jgi:hypothetical protein
MSEYQYYEFQAVDRRLSGREMQDLRSFSTRARISPTSFVNEYSFGSFKGDEDAWMEKYFDGYLYLANWGTHILQLGLPAKVLPPKTASLYCSSDAASVREKSGKVIFTFTSQDEDGGEWVEGEGILSSLLPLRADLARGDLRSLYVGWLLSAQTEELDDEAPEPPVPPNLGDLSGPLSNLVDFLRIDPNLLAVAAQASPRTKATSVNREELVAWVALLPTKEKDDSLIRLMEGEDGQLGIDLYSRFSQQRAAGNPVTQLPRRTVAELMAAAETLGEKRQREEAREAAAQKVRREHLAAVAREKHLDSIAGRELELCAKIKDLIATKQPKRYDLAVQHLVDLRDLASRQGSEADFAHRLAVLRSAHSTKRTFIERLRSKGM